MRKTIAFIIFVISFLFLFVACGTSIKGTYYSWNSYKYELDKSYSITFESKGQWHDSDGFSGTYEVDGSNITIYVTIMGFTEKMCDGTIGNGKFEYKIYETHTFYKEGYEPKKEDETTKTDPITEDTKTETQGTTEGSKTEEATPQVELFTVKFVNTGDTTIESVEVEKGKRVTKPEDPTKKGYTFLGWYTTDNMNMYGDTSLSSLIYNDTTKEMFELNNLTDMPNLQNWLFENFITNDLDTKVAHSYYLQHAHEQDARFGGILYTKKLINDYKERIMELMTLVESIDGSTSWIDQDVKGSFVNTCISYINLYKDLVNSMENYVNYLIRKSDSASAIESAYSRG